MEAAPGVERKPLGYVVRITDTQGKITVLWNAQFHIGSILSTPTDFIIGEDVEQHKWHRVGFDEIKRIETFFKPVDPLTGMANPIFARIVKKDGEVLELMACKPCSLSGYLVDGRRASYWASLVQRVEFLGIGDEGYPKGVEGANNAQEGSGGR